MNDSEFLEILENVQRCSGEIEPEAIQFLRRKFVSLPTSTWKKICDRVITAVRFKPKIADFFKAADAIGPGLNQPSTKGRACDNCEGTGFLRIYVEIDGAPYPSLEPCEKCNVGALRAGMHRAQTCRITRERFLALGGIDNDFSSPEFIAEGVGRLNPKMARSILKLMDRKKIEFPQQVLHSLIDCAGKDPIKPMKRKGPFPPGFTEEDHNRLLREEREAKEKAKKETA